MPTALPAAGMLWRLRGSIRFRALIEVARLEHHLLRAETILCCERALAHSAIVHGAEAATVGDARVMVHQQLHVAIQSPASLVT